MQITAPYIPMILPVKNSKTARHLQPGTCEMKIKAVFLN
jgi:hypothetical protein